MLVRSMGRLGALLVLMAAPLAAQAPESAGITIGGEVPTPIVVHAADIARLPHVSITASDHGKVATYDGVPLVDVLGLAGLKVGETLRGPRLASVVLVEAKDNYHVAFALAELDSAFRAKPVLLVDKVDGRPLDEKVGPYRIVVADETRPARWIRQVTAIYVVLATPPKAP